MDQQKQKLRRKAAKLRSAIAAEVRMRGSLAVAKTGLQLSRLAPGSVIAGYYPVRDELNSLPLMKQIAASGFRCALPVVEDVSASLLFRHWRAGEPLRDGQFNIKIPLDDAPLVTPAILLVPLLAFDRHGTRLGYGGGFYDRTLRKLRAQGKVTAIGLAFDEQEFDELPREPHDETLNHILTPAGLRRFGKS